MESSGHFPFLLLRNINFVQGDSAPVAEAGESQWIHVTYSEAISQMPPCLGLASEGSSH